MPQVFNGNGKIDRTPLPERPRKIKRVTFETFLYIKGLFRNIKRPRISKRRKHHKKPAVSYIKTDVDTPKYTSTYEPSEISNTRDSLFWSWRRVVEWEKYINDPLEKIKRAPYNLL